MKLSKLFRKLKAAAPLIIAAAPTVIETVKAVKKATKKRKAEG